MDEKFTYFWKGPFSQWYRSRFVIDGIEYNCCEQYMMAEKARLFVDKETEKAIMEASHPRDQKALGRQVKGFDVKRWNQVAKDIVYKGNVAKFRQNEQLLKKLKETEGTTLVEASPEDPIWGVALSEDDPRIKSRETWRGTNWLGEVLTMVRNDLMK